MPIIHANGVDLFYESMGTGEPLLILAGFACDHTIWAKVVPALARQYRVISFDNRGMGQSPASKSPVSVRDMAEDAAGLLKSLGLGPVHVAGHSMGGMIAQELALAHPEMVRSLSLLASFAQTDARGKAIIESWGDMPTKVDPLTMTRALLPWMYTNGFYSQPGVIDKLIQLILANPFPPSAQAIYDQSRAISASNTTDCLNKITCPTLIMVGSDDILAPVSSSQQLAQGIRGSELVVLEKTGHGLLIETPEMVVKTMLDFLSQVRG
ncbi:MAG TPA: alpha/beta hydrolase [Gemmatales bacterium]|nr:alpha/beta hydrolase [Gemmatales bacterium]